MSNVLDRHQFYQSHLSASQREMDLLSQNFTKEATNVTSLLGMTAASFAFKATRLAFLSGTTSSLGKFLPKVVMNTAASALGLVAEVSTLRASNKLAAKLSGEGSGEDIFERKGFLGTTVDIFALKSIGHAFAHQNFILREFASANAMVFGHAASAYKGWTREEGGTYLDKISKAVVTNFQLGAGQALLHGMLPGLRSLEASMDFSSLYAHEYLNSDFLSRFKNIENFSIPRMASDQASAKEHFMAVVGGIRIKDWVLRKLELDPPVSDAFRDEINEIPLAPEVIALAFEGDLELRESLKFFYESGCIKVFDELSRFVSPSLAQLMNKKSLTDTSMLRTSDKTYSFVASFEQEILRREEDVMDCFAVAASMNPRIYVSLLRGAQEVKEWSYVLLARMVEKNLTNILSHTSPVEIIFDAHASERVLGLLGDLISLNPQIISEAMIQRFAVLAGVARESTKEKYYEVLALMVKVNPLVGFIELSALLNTESPEHQHYPLQALASLGVKVLKQRMKDPLFSSVASRALAYLVIQQRSLLALQALKIAATDVSYNTYYISSMIASKVSPDCFTFSYPVKALVFIIEEIQSGEDRGLFTNAWTALRRAAFWNPIAAREFERLVKLRRRKQGN